MSDNTLQHFTKLQLYRIVQEALNNVERHSFASVVNVSICNDATSLQITVNDNGVGFEPGKIRPEAHGLLNIRQRAQLIGARVEWRKSKTFGKGTEFKLRLPLLVQQEGKL
jgi:signal transduction histidine kinase